jgi:hypothetical protein
MSSPDSQNPGNPVPIQRLVVLFPDSEADLSFIASRAWEIAGASGARVKFLGLYEEDAREPGMRRQLATLSALVNDGSVTAEAEVVRGRDWVTAVRARWQPGDMLVCLGGGHTVSLQKPLSQILASGLNFPLMILSGFSLPADEKPAWHARFAVWAGLIAIVTGFCLLQVRIEQTGDEWSTVLMLGSLAAEYFLIWLWNSLF